MATNSGTRWGCMPLFLLWSQGKDRQTMFEGDVRWQHTGVQVSVVDLGDRWLLLASSAIHHSHDAQENKEKQNQENCTVQHDNYCTMWGQGGDKKGMVQGLVAKTEWKRKSCNHFAGIANWLWNRLHKLYADGSEYLIWLTGKGKTFHNQAGHLYEREHFIWSTSRGNVNLPFHGVLQQFPAIQDKNI